MRLEIKSVQIKFEQNFLWFNDLKVEPAEQTKQLSKEILDLNQKLKSFKVGTSKVIDVIKSSISDQ